jgi:anti-sigma factor RsiW
MTCQFDDDLLSGYLDDELDEERRRALEDHLHECASCATRMRELTWLSDRLAASGRVERPEGLWPRIEEARREAPTAGSGGGDRRRPGSPFDLDPSARDVRGR